MLSNQDLNRRTILTAMTAVGAGIVSGVTSTPTQAAKSWKAQKKFANVLGKKMAYIERGEGRPIVFVHGNPTSSYLWRNVIPHVEAEDRRIIVLDQMGMGDSDKLPDSEEDRYRLASHTRYFEAFMKEISADEDVTLVLHDWGGAVGFNWAFHNQSALRGIAYMETFIKPLEWKDLPESFHPTLQAVRSEEGLKLVLEENMFIEKMLPGVTGVKLTEEVMAEYRRPYLNSGDDRLPTLLWAREVPLAGQPADVAKMIGDYSKWLSSSTNLPKLFVDANPGVFITGDTRKFAMSLPNQTTVQANGLHFMQEDDPNTIGRAINTFIENLK